MIWKITDQEQKIQASKMYVCMYVCMGPFNIRYVLFCAQGINMIFVLFCTVLVKMCTILYRFSQNLYCFVPFLIILYPNTPQNFALRAYPARKMIYFYTYLMLKGPSRVQYQVPKQTLCSNNNTDHSLAIHKNDTK